MRLYLLSFILFFIALSTSAQIDSRNRSVVIPPEEESNNKVSPFKIKPQENNTTSGISAPKITSELHLPKKEFSMFPEEEFGDPGELYAKQLENNTKAIEAEMGLGTKGSKTDQYFGDFKTKSKTVRVMYRDFGLEDGDLIRVTVNDEIIEYRVSLRNSFKGFNLELKEGLNKIDFLALSEGYALPNTAHFRVIDEQSNVITSNQWNLSINVKATVIIVKE
jgi:hypothetical protein